MSNVPYLHLKYSPKEFGCWFEPDVQKIRRNNPGFLPPKIKIPNSTSYFKYDQYRLCLNGDFDLAGFYLEPEFLGRRLMSKDPKPLLERVEIEANKLLQAEVREKSIVIRLKKRLGRPIVMATEGRGGG